MPYTAVKYQETPTVINYGPVSVGNQLIYEVVSTMPTNFVSAQNKDTSNFWIGAMVSRNSSGTGLNLASCASPYRPAVGIATLGSPVGFSEMAQVAGLFCLNDWTPVIGQPNLQTMSTYWLDATAGRLIPYGPAGGIFQIIGYAISPITLLLDIQPPILM